MNLISSLLQAQNHERHGIDVAANVKGLKPAANIVLIQLVDFHDKESGQCNPSAKRLADEFEMTCAMLFWHMMKLAECGLVTRHARWDAMADAVQPL
ncbi:helix-turn-helix domain-containing protein [Litoreibacter arenae]|uniref:helix-turn-helix domain-containing protein n=1 Tax=Litoreibacter arenae TaxID=491388 RepID=UPI0004051DF3|nr:helix-turn-helix domain-containing protein [Litoreibacter arenae]